MSGWLRQSSVCLRPFQWPFMGRWRETQEAQDSLAQLEEVCLPLLAAPTGAPCLTVPACNGCRTTEHPGAAVLRSIPTTGYDLVLSRVRMGPFLDVNMTSPVMPHALGHWLWSRYLHSHVFWDAVPGPPTSVISCSESEPRLGLGITRRERKEEDKAGINILFIVFSFHSLPVLRRSLVTTP